MVFLIKARGTPKRKGRIRSRGKSHIADSSNGDSHPDTEGLLYWVSVVRGENSTIVIIGLLSTHTRVMRFYRKRYT